MKGFLFLGNDRDCYGATTHLQVLSRLRCKHVMDVSSQKAEKLLDVSVAAGYENAMWGYGEALYKVPDYNRIVQIGRIQRFIYKGLIRPVRIVIDSKGCWWPDNLHTTIAHILCQGSGCKVIDIPFYIIDLSAKQDVVTIYDPYRLVDLNRADDVIHSALMRESQTNDQIRSVNYSIQEFMADNNICWEALTLEPVYKYMFMMSVKERLKSGKE